MVSPGTAEAGPVFSAARSAMNSTALGDVLTLLLPDTGSLVEAPALATWARSPAPSGGTSALRVYVLLSPAGRDGTEGQVTARPTWEAGGGDAEAKRMTTGSESVTSRLAASLGPLLVTVMV